MAIGTGIRDAYCSMVGIGCLIVICQMASYAGIRRIAVIAVMTGNAGNCCMSSIQHIIIVMYRECSRLPAGCCCMAVGTGIRNVFCNVIGIR